MDAPGTHTRGSGRWRLLALLLGGIVLVPLHGTGASSKAATPDSFVPADSNPQNTRQRLLDNLGVSQWHQAGFRGRGLKVAILDTGFQGYRQYLGKCLPDQITAKSFRLDGDLEARASQHGILCGEVIHSLAPDAELLFANWEPDQPESFLAAIRWARAQGARLISCSVIMPTWSDGEGHGAVHRALTSLLGAGDSPDDLLCFASAGNMAATALERYVPG